jgi:transcriptional regulator with XRE-family HTH domain
MSTPHAERVTSRVREVMAARRVSQTAVARHLGVSQAYVERRITDRLKDRVDFTVAELERMAVLLEVPLAELLAGSTLPPVAPRNQPEITDAETAVA